jgi:hypothetical protein
MDEIWLPIVGYPDYEISNLGRVKSLARLVWRGPVGYCLKGEIIRKPTVDGQGYPMVTLGTPKRSCYIHALVAAAFMGSTPEGMEIRHDDGNRENPRLDNLLFGTRSQNIMDAYRHGTRNFAFDRKRGIKAAATRARKASQ